MSSTDMYVYTVSVLHKFVYKFKYHAVVQCDQVRILNSTNESACSKWQTEIMRNKDYRIQNNKNSHTAYIRKLCCREATTFSLVNCNSIAQKIASSLSQANALRCYARATEVCPVV